MTFRKWTTTRGALGALTLALFVACDTTDPFDPIAADHKSQPANDNALTPVSGPDRAPGAPAPTPSNPGSAPTRPSSSGVLFADNFDSGARSSGNGFTWGNTDADVTVSSDQAYSGRYSLRFRFGPDADGDDSSAEQRFAITPNAATAPREVWVEYMIRVPDNYTHRNSSGPDNNKLAAFWAENYNATTTETLVAIEFERRAQDGSSFLRLSSAKAEGYENRDPDDVQLVAGTLFDSSMRGKWVRIRMHLKAAPRASIVDVWRDNTLVARLPADYSIANPSWSRNYIRNGYLLGWSNSGYSQTTDFYIDDFKIFTTNPGW